MPLEIPSNAIPVLYSLCDSGGCTYYQATDTPPVGTGDVVFFLGWILFIQCMILCGLVFNSLAKRPR